MIERILLAAIITFCVYLFLNLGGKSSHAPAFDARVRAVPGFIARASLFIW